MTKKRNRCKIATLVLISAGIGRAHDITICKVSDTRHAVTGTFQFTITGQSGVFSVNVGECLNVPEVGTAPVTVEELPVADVEVTAIAVQNAASFEPPNLAAGTVTVVVQEGGSTKVTFTNATIQVPAGARWTGGGSITPTTLRVTHGFELHCSVNALPNNLEINWGAANANRFHLTALTTVTCGSTPSPCNNGSVVTDVSGQPSVPYITATGTGTYNGVSGATIGFLFTDAGEPGNNDYASYTIQADSTAVLSRSGCLDSGNQQFHPTH